MKEQNSQLFYFKVQVVEEPDTWLEIATTRPETMLGDTAVAVNPDDERYKHLVGKHAVLPLVGRLIPIVADDYSDPEKGSGAVKITPAHDFNDFEVGRRHNLPSISVLDQEARMSLSGNEDYLRGLPEAALIFAEELDGKDRFAARKLIVAKLEEAGFLEKIEPNTSGSAPAFTMTTTKAPMMYATVMSGTKRSEKRPIRRRPPSTTRAVSTAIAPVTTYGLMS